MRLSFWLLVHTSFDNIFNIRVCIIINIINRVQFVSGLSNCFRNLLNKQKISDFLLNKQKISDFLLNKQKSSDFLLIKQKSSDFLLIKQKWPTHIFPTLWSAAITEKIFEEQKLTEKWLFLKTKVFGGLIFGWIIFQKQTKIWLSFRRRDILEILSSRFERRREAVLCSIDEFKLLFKLYKLNLPRHFR